MADLFPGLDDFMAQKESDAAAGYEKRMLTMLIRRLCDRTELDYKRTVTRYMAEGGKEFGFEWFLSNVNCVFPINIHTARLTDLKHHNFLTQQFSKGPLWKAYFEIYGNYGNSGYLAMVFPMTHAGNWVMHNGPESLTPCGENYIVRSGQEDGYKLFIQRFNSFAEQLARMIDIRE